MRVPRGLQELQLEVAKKRDELTGSLGRSPTVQELADAIEAPFEEVLATIQSAGARRTRSLDEPTGEDMTLADSIGGRDIELERAEMRVLLDDAMDVLSDRDREVLAAALRRRPDPDRDLRAHRGLPDAGLAHHPPVDRQAALGHRQGARGVARVIEGRLNRR